MVNFSENTHILAEDSMNYIFAIFTFLAQNFPHILFFDSLYLVQDFPDICVFFIFVFLIFSFWFIIFLPYSFFSWGFPDIYFFIFLYLLEIECAKLRTLHALRAFMPCVSLRLRCTRALLPSCLAYPLIFVPSRLRALRALCVLVPYMH